MGKSLSHLNDNTNRLSAANAQGCEPALFTALSECIEKGDDHASPAGANGMAERYGANNYQAGRMAGVALAETPPPAACIEASFW